MTIPVDKKIQGGSKSKFADLAPTPKDLTFIAKEKITQLEKERIAQLQNENPDIYEPLPEHPYNHKSKMTWIAKWCGKPAAILYVLTTVIAPIAMQAIGSYYPVNPRDLLYGASSVQYETRMYEDIEGINNPEEDPDLAPLISQEKQSLKEETKERLNKTLTDLRFLAQLYPYVAASYVAKKGEEPDI